MPLVGDQAAATYGRRRGLAGVAFSNLKCLPFPSAPVWPPANGNHGLAVNFQKSASAKQNKSVCIALMYKKIFYRTL